MTVRPVGEDDTYPSEPVVEREFSSAEQMLEDARKAHEVGISKATIVNRLYFACFHGAQAALYDRGCNPQSHSGVQTLFGRELVQTGEVSRELGRLLNDMETYRRRVDYGAGGVERDAEELLEQTSEFLDAICELLS